MKGNLQQRSLFNTKELYCHSQPSPGWPDFQLHSGLQLLVQIVIALQKSSQQKQTTQVWLALNVEFNSLFMYLCVHSEKSDLLTWVSFARPSHI